MIAGTFLPVEMRSLLRQLQYDGGMPADSQYL